MEYEVIRTAFEEFGLNKLCCEVLATNASVISMHESFGFRREALFRQHVWKSDKPVDVVALALLRSEWLMSQPGLRDRLIARGVLEKTK